MINWSPPEIRESAFLDLQRSNFTFDRNGNTTRRVEASLSGSYFDSFGRLAVATPFKLYEYSSNYPHDFVRYHAKIETGGATVSQDATNASTHLNLGTASGDRAVFQSRRKIQYNKANSQEIFTIWKPCIGKANLVQRIGYFDDNNGVFWQKDGSTFSCVVRSGGTDLVFDRSTWDDPLDGTGPSRINYDIDNGKQFVFKISFGWLSSRGASFIIDVGGEFVLVKNYMISGTLDGPFMQTPQLPLRIESFNKAATSSASISSFSCWAVQSSGSQEQEGSVRKISSSFVTEAVTTTPTIVAGYRINPAYKNASIKPISFAITSVSGDAFMFFRAVYNPTIVNGVWTNVDGIGQVLSSYGSFSGGSNVVTGHYYLGDKKDRTDTTLKDNLSDIYLGYNQLDVPDSIILVAVADKNSTVYYDEQYKEFI